MSRPKKDPSDPLFHKYGAKGPKPELVKSCLDEAGAVYHTSARDRFGNIEPGISVREGIDRFNYEFFRPGEASPRGHHEVIDACDHIYRHNCIVNFAINMMTDFVIQGMQVYHPAASKQKRYRHWWKKVGGYRVSERLVNLLYRHAVPIVKRNFADLNEGDLKDLDRAAANIDPEVTFRRTVDVEPNRIPMQYTFLNPRTIEVLGGELAMFGNSPTNPIKYGLRIPENLLKTIKSPRNDEEKAIVNKLPSYIKKAVSSGNKIIPLDPDKVSALYYKKDDWQQWPDPMILSIMKDITLYEKMKDADRAALDGSISRIRLWTLGLPEHQIQPGPGAFKKLKEQLLANTGGGSMDLVWDASLKLTESSSDVYKFLGSAKYEPVLQAIYAGLGIPQSLTGGEAGGMTNNALSLKTLIERLQYARSILIEFWEREFSLLQRAFGDRQPAKLRFDMMTLSDEASEKMIWVQLYDRNLVTTETMREKFGLLPDVEIQRQRREYKDVENGKSPSKIGPFTEAQPHPDQLSKAAMTQGLIAPSEAGVVTKPKKKGDKSALDRQEALQKQQMENDQKLAEQQQEIKNQQSDDLHKQKLKQKDDIHKKKLKETTVKPKGQPGQGRPQGKKDETKRKQRTPKVSAQVMARELYREVSESLTSQYLDRCNKKNLRSLTTAQSKEFEVVKFNAMLLGESFDFEAVIPTEAESLIDDLVHESYGCRNKLPTTDEMREMYISAYAIIKTEELEDGEV